VRGDGLRLAVGTFTALPIKPPSLVDRSGARVAMVLAPLAVLPIAAVALGVGELARLLTLSPLIVSVLLIGTFALGSRGLHLDGLADTADGLTASYNTKRALEIMRRGNTGPAGAAALVLVLALQITALAPILARPWGLPVAVVLLCLARSSLLITCAAGVSAAREAGLGVMVAGVVPRWLGAIGGLLAAAAAAVTSAGSGRPWWHGPLAVLAAAIVVFVLMMRCRKRFGGITGDVLGAGIEVAAAVLLVASSS